MDHLNRVVVNLIILDFQILYPYLSLYESFLSQSWAISENACHSGKNLSQGAKFIIYQSIRFLFSVKVLRRRRKILS